MCCAVVKGCGDAGERAEAGAGTVRDVGPSRMRPTAHDGGIGVRAQGRKDVLDHGSTRHVGERFIGSEPAGAAAGDDRAEDHRARNKASARTTTWSVNSASLARRAARSLGAETVASIGHPASAAFSTSS